MGPRLEDDGFVLTISDDDTSIPILDEEEDFVPLIAKPKPILNGKKRKRDGGVSDEARSTSGGQTKRKKRANNNAVVSLSSEENAERSAEYSEDAEDGWAAGGQDDGAMNSDFEFQMGDMDTGVVEDFDGWGLEETATATSRGNKKGVDIDELIARRRKDGKPDQRPADVDRSSRSDEAEDLEDSLGAAEEDLPTPDIIGAVEEREEEDELLAPDGFGMGATGQDEDSDHEDARDSSDERPDQELDSDDESIASPVPHPDDKDPSIVSGDDENDPAEQARTDAFFAPEENINKTKAMKEPSMNSFQSMSLSRPILRGLASVGFSEPTPIQVKTIPIALLGKDVVGGAVTGSGKTAAFMIPILERLLYRPKKVPTSRVAILMPTRELAVQCFNVAKKLASFTDITFCQLVGGFSLREQESVLRSRPDVIIATPGRFIDHMRNSASFTVDTLEILVLDEADRMLEDGFADELNEILTTIPKSRQTMLFSATMTSSVDKLIRVGLNRPVRLMVDARRQTVGTLVQEFVRLRPGREDKRLAYLMHLCFTVYTDRVIVFFRQKKEAHRVRIIFGVCGFKAAELHGSMTQEQRIGSIESFRSGKVTHLLATDVASRGLDIKGVETVINYEAPQSHEIYLHRVGRTARAGRAGRSCTIAAEPDRKVVKEAVRSGKAQGAKIFSRAVEPALVDEWSKKIGGLEHEVEAIMKEEKEEKQLGQAEMQVRKGENIMEHQGEILSRPKRTWFESEKEKQVAKNAGRTELNGLENKKGKKKEGKLSGKDKKRLDDARERLEGKIWKKGKEDRGSKSATRKGGKAKDGAKRPGEKSKGNPFGEVNKGKGGRR